MGGADRAGDRELSRRELEVLAITYLELLDVKLQKFGSGRGRPQWIALGECEPGEVGGLLIGFWHCGPGSLYAVAVQALGAMGYGLRSNGELYEI